MFMEILNSLVNIKKLFTNKINNNHDKVLVSSNMYKDVIKLNKNKTVDRNYTLGE